MNTHKLIRNISTSLSYTNVSMGYRAVSHSSSKQGHPVPAYADAAAGMLKMVDAPGQPGEPAVPGTLRTCKLQAKLGNMQIVSVKASAGEMALYLTLFRRHHDLLT